MTGRRDFLKFLGAGAFVAAVHNVTGIAAPSELERHVIKSGVIVPTDMNAFIPELWAKESLKILEQNMAVTGQLIRRDFSDEYLQDAVDTIAGGVDRAIIGKLREKGMISEQQARVSLGKLHAPADFRAVMLG